MKAIDSELIDIYQLKSLGGLFESELGLDNQAIVEEGDKLLLTVNPQFSNSDQYKEFLSPTYQRLVDTCVT